MIEMEDAQTCCQSCDILKARVRADLGVYVDTVGLDSDVRSAARRIERARLAYRTARQKFHTHVDSHCDEMPAVE